MSKNQNEEPDSLIESLGCYLYLVIYLETLFVEVKFNNLNSIFNSVQRFELSLVNLNLLWQPEKMLLLDQHILHPTPLYVDRVTFDFFNQPVVSFVAVIV